MVPAIGVMIGGYIGFRCLEVWCKKDDDYRAHGHTVLAVAAALLLALIGFCLVGLTTS